MSSWQIRRAVNTLDKGGVIAYPTEAVYGLGCDPWNGLAVQKLLDIKQRSWRKGLIIIAADFNQLQGFIDPVSAQELQLLEATWPGPTTWLLPKSSECPTYLSGIHNTIAVRVTAHKQTAELCRQFGGAIVSTSANMAGAKPAKTVREIRWNLANIDTVLPGQCSGSQQPTEIKELQTGTRLR